MELEELREELQTRQMDEADTLRDSNNAYKAYTQRRTIALCHEIMSKRIKELEYQNIELQESNDAIELEFQDTVGPLEDRVKELEIENEELEGRVLTLDNELTDERINTFWHEVKYCRLIQHRVGIIGSLTYLIDREDRAISKGYHSIGMGFCGRRGEIGSREEEVKIVDYRDNPRAKMER